MDSMIKLFGEYEIFGFTVYQWVLIGSFGAFVIRKAMKAMNIINDMHKSYQEREEEFEESKKSRVKIEKELKRLADVQAENIKKLARFEAELKSRDKNKLKRDLLRWFHYYTNRAKNPQHAWTEMEADVFWSNFADYENLNGNGFMHSDVQPAMNSLEVIKMDDRDRLASLYASRSG